jgi:3'-phosphoadenosine 5'-phosphosulfate sulfotransferase (PAPS reductase)/FAD synthetase
VTTSQEQSLLDHSNDVINEAFERGAEVMAPLFSSGHDSLTAVFLASLHPKFDGTVYHIDTGIGARASRDFAHETAHEYGWTLAVLKSKDTYEQFIRDRGFPGPGRHMFAYNRLKERCVQEILRMHGKAKVALITGCRSQESVRRMGNVEPLKIGDTVYGSGQPLFNIPPKVINKRRYWTAPCHAFSESDQVSVMDGNDLPRNPIKMSPLGMSGECFCGAFARVDELTMIRRYAPDVATEIDRLSVIAKQCGKHDVWGTRPDKAKGTVTAQTGPLCNSCDARAMSAGLFIESVT